MSTTLKTRIVKIGNSQGIRIPKGSLEQAGLDVEVELDVQFHQIVIRPAHPTRHDWEKRFDTMAAQGDDAPLDQLIATGWDEQEWEW